MSGQLWEPCKRHGCENEPSCLDCGGCQGKHCDCARRTQVQNRELFQKRLHERVETLIGDQHGSMPIEAEKNACLECPKR